MKKTKVTMNNLLCLGLLILEIVKITAYGQCYDYTKPKNGDSLKTESFVVHVKSEDFRDKTGYTYEVERTLPIGKNKNVIRLIKDEIGGKKWKGLSHWDRRCINMWQKMDILMRKQREQRNEW